MTKETEVRRQMVAMVEEWRQSGQSKSAFCVGRSLSYHKFNYWCRRLDVQCRDGCCKEEPSFIEVQLPHPKPEKHVEVIYPDGKRILFHREVAAGFLRTLLN